MKVLSPCLWVAILCFLKGYGDECLSFQEGEPSAVRATEEGCCIPLVGMTEALPQGVPPSMLSEQKTGVLRRVSGPSSDLCTNALYQQFSEAVTSLLERSGHLPIFDVRTMAGSLFRSEGRETVRQIENIEINSRGQNTIPLRIYIPKASTALPVIVYFHPGGWAFGSVEEADLFCRKMANIIGTIVVSVGYRLAPEHPFPAGLEDCYAATCWVADNIDSFGGDHTNISVCGEGAGGNLAAGVALMARDKSEPTIRSQLLICPPICALFSEEPYAECPDQYFLTHEAMKWVWKMYLPFPGDAGNPYASVDRVRECGGVAPAVIITAEYDPLHREAEEYGLRLRRSGVTVVSKRFSGVIHGFFSLPIYDEDQKSRWLQEVKQLIKKLENLCSD